MFWSCLARRCSWSSHPHKLSPGLSPSPITQGEDTIEEITRLVQAKEEVLGWQYLSTDKPLMQEAKFIMRMILHAPRTFVGKTWVERLQVYCSYEIQVYGKAPYAKVRNLAFRLAREADRQA